MADRRCKIGSAGLTLALLGAVSGSAAAQTPPPARVYHACYVDGTGTVFLINESGLLTSCPSSSKPFGWTDGDQAIRVGTAGGGDLSGTFPNPSVVGLRGRLIDPASPADGQVLRFDATSNMWKAATPTGGGGTSEHGALTGLNDDDHAQYLLVDGARQALNGFAVTGVLGSGGAAATGAGTRLLWFPARAAFLAGYLDESNATSWDYSNVGAGSLAVGLNVMASGQGSQALGAGNVASGFYSRAIGNGATASGDYSTVIGPNGTASGNSATAIGFLAVASGDHAMALGHEITASGVSSTVMGFNASSGGYEGTFVYGDRSFSDPVQPTAPNQFVVRAQGGVYLRTHGTLVTGCNLPANSGSWDCSSSVTLKTSFEPVEGEDVLARVRDLPVQRWSYRGEGGVRHLGTFAEDFHRAFGLGTGETTIGMIDMDGVNLAAAQALERRTRELQTQLADRGEEIRLLRAQLNDVIRRVEQLERGRQ